MNRAGFRAGDLPFKYQHGVLEFIHQLEASRGTAVEIRVISNSNYNAQRWSATRHLRITVPAPPPAQEVQHVATIRTEAQLQSSPNTNGRLATSRASCGGVRRVS